MKKLFTFIALLFAMQASAQGPVYYPSQNYIRVVHTGTDTLLNPFTGGLMNPIFSNIDIDLDVNERQDLFVFDRFDSKVLLFKSAGKGRTDYFHVPQYEHYFPAMDFGKLNLYAFTKDYNGDGKADIIMHSSPYMPPYNPVTLTVYKNTSGANLNFNLIAPEIYYETKDDVEGLALPNDGIPAIEDVDGDGDLDILFFPGGSTKVRHLRNMSVELSKPKDSLIFWYVEECWGSFAEDGSSVVLGYTKDCNNSDIKSAKKKHAGSAVVILDADGDGDADMLLSEAAKPAFKFLENGRIANGTVKSQRDTIIKVSDNWPITKKGYIMNMPYASIIDADNDGKRDAIIAPLDGTSAVNTDFIWYYHDDATTGKSDLRFKSHDFLVNSMMDWGNYSIPILIDYNLDGLTDLIVSAMKKYPTGIEERINVYYKNIGTASKPVFKQESNNLQGLINTVDSDFVQAISVSDLNNDDVADLLIGLLTGEVIFYQGSEGTNNLEFQRKGALKVMDGSNLVDLNVGANASPAFSDFDGDGKKDVIIGNSQFKLGYYKNVSSGTTPIFELVTANYGDIAISGGFGAPTLTDLDANGKPELILGGSDGKIFIYPDAKAQPDTNWTPYSNTFYDFGTSQTGDKDFGSNTFVATALLDQDAIPDMIIGNARGGLYYMGSTNNGIGTHPVLGIAETSASEQALFNIYPNPTSDKLTINFNGPAKPGKYDVIIRDISGRELSRANAELSHGVSQTLDVSTLSSGVYFISLSDTSGRVQTQKFIKR